MVVAPTATHTRFRTLDRLLSEVASAGILDAIQILPALQQAAGAAPPDRAVDLLAPVVVSHREDPLSAYLAIHALASVASVRVDELLTELLDTDAPGLQEHAAWALSERRPVEVATGGLLRLARRGGFGQMLAELTLEWWSRLHPSGARLPDGSHHPGRTTSSTPMRTHTRPGLRIAQVLMQGRIDGDLTAGGSGDGGGLATLQVSLTRELASHQEVAEVFLLTRSITGEETRFATPRERIDTGATIVRIDFGPDGYVPTADMWPYRPELECRLRRFFSTEGPFDGVHLRFADVGTFAAARVAHELGIPIFFTLAPDPHALIARAEAEGRLTRANFGQADLEQHLLFRTWLVGWMVEHATRLALLPREGHAEQFDRLLGLDISAHPDRFRLIPEGIDSSLAGKAAAEIASETEEPGVVATLESAVAALPPRRQGLPLLVSVGRLNRVKGFDRLVRAWSTDPAVRNGYNLVIVGGNLDHPSPEEVTTLSAIEAAHGGVSEGLILLGNRSHDDVARLLAVAVRGRRNLVGSNGVYVCASEKEEFGLAIIEAMAAGLPVVAPREGGPATYVDHAFTGYLADTTDASDLALGLIWADGTRNSEVRADAARRLVRNRYSIGAMADLLVSLYMPAVLEESAE